MSGGVASDPTQLEGSDFQNLVFDIHTTILHLVSARDLIALRKTCKAMADATSLRSVWITALMRMCFENCVLMSSFDLPKMSLLELEYAAMGPERWAGAMARAHSNKLTFLPPYRFHELRPPDYFSSFCPQIFLVPGGRYLLILCQEVISIWDLLDISEPPNEPLATISGSCQDFMATPTPDGLGIRVGVTKYSGYSPIDAHDLRYEIHSFTFTKENPTFEMIGSLSVLRKFDSNFAYICGDRLIITDGPAVKVWNFVTDGWATWLTVVTPHEIIVSGDIIVFVGKSGVFLWDIPPLHSGARLFFAEPYSAVPVPPLLSIGYIDFQYPRSFHELECTPPGDWYTGTAHSLWFDLCVKTRAARLPFNRFELQLVHDDPLSSALRPIRKSYHPIPLGLYGSLYRICGDNAFMWWPTENTIECTLGPTHEEDASREDYRITLLNAIDIEPTVCPISGRLCYVCHDTNSIKIFDFFAPPPNKA